MSAMLPWHSFLATKTVLFYGVLSEKKAENKLTNT